jgi:Amt family ammonium transporter
MPSGVIEGNWKQLANQAGGVALAWVISIVGTLVLLKLVDMTVGLRVTPSEEIEGLDIALHGEEGYDNAS